MSESSPVTHVTRSGSLVLPLPLTEAFPLFTAEGERGWVPGWEPQYLHPPRPSNDQGTVFRTDHGGEETFWIVLRYEPSRGVAEYGRFTPGSRLGTVSVECTELELSRTRVQVTYALTAISDEGRDALAKMGADAYEAMLEEWRELIIQSL
jgi:hypothetical protein